MKSIFALNVLITLFIRCHCVPADLNRKSAVDESPKSRTSRHVADLVACLGTFDASCALDKAEDAIGDVTRSFWDEADKQSLQTGRAEDDSKPSALMESISKIISELTDIFKDGITGFFRDGKDNDNDVEEDDDEDDDEEEVDDSEKSRGVEESRGKKKKKKKAIMKLLLLGAVVATKIKLLLKALAIHLQVKFLFIALAGLLINAARFYLDLKKGHQPQKVIYYEHAQHQHHYDSDDDWHGGWSRSYDEDNKRADAQEVAYSHQRPQGITYSRVNEKPNYSWE